MNGFADKGLSEGDFGDAKGLSVKAFDAFPKTKPSYLTNTRNGGIWTIVLTAVCIYLTSTELWRWMVGTTTHTFSVEKGIAHDLQINLDIVIAMRCRDVHINVQDASGDRVMAGDKLKKDPTMWSMWGNKQTTSSGRGVGVDGGWTETPQWEKQQALQYAHEDDVHDYLGAAAGKRSFAKTPRMRGGEPYSDSCRVYGTLETNKVQGDFHITARGHGYFEFGEHLDHTTFNFSHHINELSFGAFYPQLLNPLDNTRSTTPAHFYKYQYYLSIVPTIYTDSPQNLHARSRAEEQARKEPRPQFDPFRFAPHTIFTNQYAVTEQSHEVAETQIPGVFVKYDIEPILLTVAEEWGGFLGMVVRCVNVIAGVLVAGGWIVSLVDWIWEGVGRRRRGRSASGLLHGEKGAVD